MKKKAKQEIDFLKNEIRNFQNIAAYLHPSSGEIPRVKGIDIYGDTIPLHKKLGGDHIIYVDFNKRYDLNRRIKNALKSGDDSIAKNLRILKHRAGILIADSCGHNITDALLTAMLHQAFLTGILYELEQHGQVTTQLFEHLNTRFFNSSSVSKFITLLYGEISERGNFRFLNAGHPPPIFFSHKFNGISPISNQKLINFQPIGTLPSQDDIDARKIFSRLGYKKKYPTQEINLMEGGDILILATDGLTEHSRNMEHFYYPKVLNSLLKQVKTLTAKEIFTKISEDMLVFSPPEDDISFVIIKKL